MPKTLTKRKASASPDLPYAMNFSDGRTLLVSVPGRWVVKDRSGETCFTPEGVRFLDRCRSVFTPLDRAPSPGFIRTFREALGQAKFGERVGVDKLTIYRWERGELRPGAESVQAIRKLREQAARKGVVIDG